VVQGELVKIAGSLAAMFKAYNKATGRNVEIEIERVVAHDVRSIFPRSSLIVPSHSLT
jgi:hypothetical protein